MPNSGSWLAPLLHSLPHHLISRLTHRLARWESPRLQPLLRRFVQRYGLDMHEAEVSDLSHYRSFNALFTRALHPTARPLAGTADTIVSPADATLSAYGRIEADRLIRAKGHDYSLSALLGGYEDLAQPFVQGQFLSAYLSPRDYHRLHMPLTGQLTQMVYVPGRLFSVAPAILERIPDLHARNERVIAFFDTPAGRMALVLIGAINVGSIETVWAGEVTPPRKPSRQRWNYTAQPITLERGDEMGRFNLGSSIVVCFAGSTMQWDNDRLQIGQPLRLRQAIGSIKEPPQYEPEQPTRS